MPRPLHAFRLETLQRGVRQRWITVWVFYARFECCECGRIWTSWNYRFVHQLINMISVINKFGLSHKICLMLREFELRGDILPWHQRCENCGELNLPVWVDRVRPLVYRL